MKRKKTPAASEGFRVKSWHPLQKNTLQGFVSLELPSGMIIHDCTMHEKNGSRWIGLPARQFEKDGERAWSPLVEFSSKEARNKFQDAALAAFDEHLGGGL
jgi:hypothetical protein